MVCKDYLGHHLQPGNYVRLVLNGDMEKELPAHRISKIDYKNNAIYFEDLFDGRIKYSAESYVLASYKGEF